jgi:hypothetical protein
LPDAHRVRKPELNQAERCALEAPLEECSGCRLTFEEELALKRKIRQAGERIHAPALLRSRLLSDGDFGGASDTISRR